MLTLRTFPIRVGNIISERGRTLGRSGPFHPDSEEISWGDLGVEPEVTTVTKRVRRVATFSLAQYEKAVDLLAPTHVFLNFVNYLPNDRAVDRFLAALEPIRRPTHLGFGPDVGDVREI